MIKYRRFWFGRHCLADVTGFCYNITFDDIVVYTEHAAPLRSIKTMRAGDPLSRAALALFLSVILTALSGPTASRAADTNAPEKYLRFDGTTGYAEIPSAPELGVSATGFTVAVWMRPDTLTFAKTQGSLPGQQYVHLLAKGEPDQYSWTFRMYSRTDPGPRRNRGEWIEVAGVVDQSTQMTSNYKNGHLRHTDSSATIRPQPGLAPVRIGTGDFSSFFQGALGPIEIWNRPLAAAEIRALYRYARIPAAGLVAHYAMDEGAGSLLHDSVSHDDGGSFPVPGAAALARLTPRAVAAEAVASSPIIFLESFQSDTHAD